MPTRRLQISLAMGCLALAITAAGDEKLARIACRSVHLQQSGPAGTAFYNELTVEKSAEGTYFCVCGFNHGYYGLQEQRGGKKVLIFSVWDPGKQNDPNAVADEQRVKLLDKDDAVRVGRFGNEGTGGQSFLDFDWQPGETYRFLVTATPNEKRTEFSAWFFLPEQKQSEAGNREAGVGGKWKKLATFSTITAAQKSKASQSLSGYYSFVEDFRRNRVSTEHARRARFGNGWVRDTSGKWQPIASAKFTADSNPATNIDAGQAAGRFFLATGGDTKNDGTKLSEQIVLPMANRQPPADLPQ